MACTLSFRVLLQFTVWQERVVALSKEFLTSNTFNIVPSSFHFPDRDSRISLMENLKQVYFEEHNFHQNALITVQMYDYALQLLCKCHFFHPVIPPCASGNGRKQKIEPSLVRFLLVCNSQVVLGYVTVLSAYQQVSGASFILIRVQGLHQKKLYKQTIMWVC